MCRDEREERESDERDGGGMLAEGLEGGASVRQVVL